MASATLARRLILAQARTYGVSPEWLIDAVITAFECWGRRRPWRWLPFRARYHAFQRVGSAYANRCVAALLAAKVGDGE